MLPLPVELSEVAARQFSGPSVALSRGMGTASAHGFRSHGSGKLIGDDMKTAKIASIATSLFIAVGVMTASPANAQTPADNNTAQYQRDEGFDMGWIGLLGLAGLFGLKRRDRADHYETGTASRANR
jgi:hypothetical protein